MNYGEEYVEIYNNKIKNICNEFVLKAESYYDTNYTYRKLFRDFSENLSLEIKELCKKELSSNILNDCYELFSIFKDYYKNNIHLSIINNEVFDNFKKMKNDTEFINFQEFVHFFALRNAIRDFFKFENKNSELLIKSFNSKKMKKSFKFVKNDKEIFVLSNLISKNNSIKHSLLNKLSPNHKMIILHALKYYYKDDKGNDTDTEYFKILALCSSSLTDDDYRNINTNNNNYRYFMYGVNNSDKDRDGKKKIIDDILLILAPANGFNRIKKALNIYKKRIR